MKNYLLLLSLFLASCGVAPASLLTEATEAEIVLIAAIPGGVHGIAVNSNDDFFYSDSFGNQSRNRRVYRIAKPYTSPTEPIGIAGSLPSGLEFSAAGLLLADTGANAVKSFDCDLLSNGRYEATQPWNVSQTPDGTLVTVSNAGTAEKLQKVGHPVRLVSDLDAPFDIIAVEDEKFWISEQGAQGEGLVTLRDAAGLEIKRIGPLDNPEGMVLDRDGNLWIADTGSDKIYRYDTGLDTLNLVTDKLAFPIAGVQTHSGAIVFNGSKNGVYGLYQIR